MAHQLQVRNLIDNIRKEHQAALSHAATAVEHVIRCGQFLIALKAGCEAGQWEALLAEAKINKVTAWRYIRVAEEAPKKRGKYLLNQGAGLVDLYRAFGIVRPCEGGGYRSETYKRRKALEDVEDQMEFSFEDFLPFARALQKARNVEKLSVSSIERLQNELRAGMERLETIKRSKQTVDIDV